MKRAASTKILFLAANPEGQARLRVDKEVSDIEEGLRHARHRDRFQLVTRLAVTIRRLRQAITEEKPQVIHFSGHGSPCGGIFLEDSRGPALVPPAALASLFEIFAGTIRCVFLNACFTKEQASRIAEHIPCVIGIDNAIGDEAAIEFAVGFYESLGAGESIVRAFDLGRAAIALQGLNDHLLPVRLGDCCSQPERNFAVFSQMTRAEIIALLSTHKAELAMDATDGDSHLSVGLVYLQLKNYEMAIRHFRQAVDLSPDNGDAYYYLALAMLRGRRPKRLSHSEVRDLRTSLRTAVTLDPHSAKYYWLLAILSHDYYYLNGLRTPEPAIPELIAKATTAGRDDWETERLLQSVGPIDSGLVQKMKASKPQAG